MAHVDRRALSLERLQAAGVTETESKTTAGSCAYMTDPMAIYAY